MSEISAIADELGRITADLKANAPGLFQFHASLDAVVAKLRAFQPGVETAEPAPAPVLQLNPDVLAGTTVNVPADARPMFGQYVVPDDEHEPDEAA